MSTSRLVRPAKVVAHTAALVFCAFWLVATSAPAVPARDCFKGLKTPTKLAITLGVSHPYIEGDVSCAGLDGLVSGATVTLDLSQGPRPEGSGDLCWGYQALSIEGPMDVSLGTWQPPSAGTGLTEVEGSYSSSRTTGCRGGWTLTLRPGVEPDAHHLVSPLDTASDGTPAQPWTVEREIEVEQAQFCDRALAGSGPTFCRDSFGVTKISEVTP